jgi:periplasmic mercuric ion binding protein
MENKWSYKMKNLIISFFLLVGIIWAKDVTETFNVEGMMCGMNCPLKVKESTAEMKGIKSCEVSFENSNAIITFDNEVIKAKTIANKIAKDTYYKVELANSSKSFWQKLFGEN